MSLAIRPIDGLPAASSNIGGVGEGADLGFDGIAPERLEPAGAVAAPTFTDLLGNLVVNASEASHDAATQADMLARGATDDLHGTMIAAKEAEISVKLVGSIRNKLLDAFQELWRTNV